ncbi:hypothetical protein F4809DRAFT_636687 [Biscogniauxia mediterranea]|nr:hypothetical protein F4809DRAFT_636687 [Biscogniauxia mediterranea]
MDTASLVSSWLSFAVTTVGLGGLITQASAINDKMDPFHASRNVEYLGIWFQRQARFPWWRIAKPPPEGPVIRAGIANGGGGGFGFCGVNTVHVTRIPLAPNIPGQAGWSLVLAMFNPEPPPRLAAPPPDGDAAEKAASSSSVLGGGGSGSRSDTKTGPVAAVKPSWDSLPRKALVKHQSSACIVISRTTLILMLVFTNGRPVFQYSDANGFRAGYASYCGQWYITWPIGQEAIVKFAAHDSIGAAEVFPRCFAHRVDRCGQMAAGVVASPSADFRVAFCGRKPPGTYRLEHSPKGFQAAHGGRHLYNMMGGRAYEVDFMFARPCSPSSSSSSSSSSTGPKKPSTSSSSSSSSGEQREEEEEDDDDTLTLDLPSTTPGQRVRMRVPPREQRVLRRALDCLPWGALSWSLHRGLRDVLCAFARRAGMDDARRRRRLAARLRAAVGERAEALVARGWDRAFVRGPMADMAASAVLAGAGNSGDAVRVVTDVVRVLVDRDRDRDRDHHHAAGGDDDDDDDGADWARLDEVWFWRRLGEKKEERKGKGKGEGAGKEEGDGEGDGREEEEEEEEEEELDFHAIVALTKVFVLEWSQEFDYQMYHHLPISLYFA